VIVATGKLVSLKVTLATRLDCMVKDSSALVVTVQSKLLVAVSHCLNLCPLVPVAVVM